MSRTVCLARIGERTPIGLAWATALLSKTALSQTLTTDKSVRNAGVVILLDESLTVPSRTVLSTMYFFQLVDLPPSARPLLAHTHTDSSGKFPGIVPFTNSPKGKSHPAGSE